MQSLLISACLLGRCCKYDGTSNALPAETLARLKEVYNLIPVCPEVASGMPVPRQRSERTETQVRTADGEDVTELFREGARIAGTLAERFDCRKALLKQKSPSCGSKWIYDGSFSGQLVEGLGTTTAQLQSQGISLYGEEELEALLPPDGRAIAAKCDHTLLRQDCTAEEIRKLCDQAITFGCASVCIPPCHVSGAKRYVGDRLKVCTVIGFPNGYSTKKAKAMEARDAVKNGADELDMVVNLSMVKDGAWDDVLDDIREVRKACRGKILKVIIECCLLSQEEKIRLCDLVTRSGADFIKTSTGFSTGGATPEDVRLLKEHVGPGVRVKAAGGISSLEEADQLIRQGADRLGTSRVVKILEKMEEEQAAQARKEAEQLSAECAPQKKAVPADPVLPSEKV